MEKFKEFRNDDYNYYSERRNLIYRILRSEEYNELLSVLPIGEDDFSEEKDRQLIETIKESLLELHQYYKNKERE